MHRRSCVSTNISHKGNWESAEVARATSTLAFLWREGGKVRRGKNSNEKCVLLSNWCGNLTQSYLILMGGFRSNLTDKWQGGGGGSCQSGVSIWQRSSILTRSFCQIWHFPLATNSHLTRSTRANETGCDWWPFFLGGGQQKRTTNSWEKKMIFFHTTRGPRINWAVLDICFVKWNSYTIGKPHVVDESINQSAW